MSARGIQRPLRRLAIANRGEAAMRCIRAVKSLRAIEGGSLEVIALYTEPDRDAPFVRHADHAIALPSQRGAVAAYLDHDVVLAAVREARADAVWPGWGFVAEDPEFADRLDAEGIRFLGPSGDTMRAVGDKISAKALAERVDVPVTPWSGGVLDDANEAARHAERIGYPIVVKAAAGGGGRGIRVVRRPEDLAAAFESARSEAEGAFGDGRMFCEALVCGGRHIEVQIAADTDGVVRSLGCRDCSVQRRHQKVIEEAPPAELDDSLRQRIEKAALRLVESVNYTGLGTVEFLVAGDEFSFLELNPRLQVEHGITEELTGLDLVQLQIRIARGESIAGLEIHERGFAIEARVCAEDPEEKFIPAPGRVARFDPSLGPRVRIDSGVVAGSEIPGDFDSLIAKVIATGDTRDEARARLACALRDFELVVEGGTSNKGYLLELLESEGYRGCPVDTSWLDAWNEQRAQAGHGEEQRDRDALVAAAILSYQRTRGIARANFYSDTANISGSRLPSQGQKVDLRFRGEAYELKVYAIGSWRYRLHLEGRAVAALMREEGRHAARLVIGSRMRRVVYDGTEMNLRVELDGHPYCFGWESAGQVFSSTPAMVVGIHVEAGDRVRAGQPLGVLEAMKTEIGFEAPVSGVVREVLVRRGQQVAAGEVLLVIDPGGEERAASTPTTRLQLPAQIDPLALLFRGRDGNPLAVPDLDVADAADRAPRREAIQSVREEIRRVLLGYDANPERGESLRAFLEAPLPDGLSAEFRIELAEVRRELVTFSACEKLFIRAPRASVSGALGPSNYARLRMYVRRMKASGAGIADEFLDLLRAALRYFGVKDLTPSDALERAVLRLLSSQLSPGLRRGLVLGMVRRLTALAESGIDLSDESELANALGSIARMRGLLPDALADAAIEASYVIFERPGVERHAEQSSKNLESWLSTAEFEPSSPPTDVLLELAAAPLRVFDRIGCWISAAEPDRREIALAAHVQRLYAPHVPIRQWSFSQGDLRIHAVDYSEHGLVLAATAGEKETSPAARNLASAARACAAGGAVPAFLELIIPPGRSIENRTLLRSCEEALASNTPTCRFTLGLLAEDGSHVFKTFTTDHGSVSEAREFHDLHPEIAGRIGLARLANFELERLPSDEDIYSFRGRSRAGEGDERVFVLAEARDRAPLAGREAAYHVPAFVRIFHQAARSLRTILQLTDPRRRLQWNRIVVSVAPEIFLDAETAADLARRLAPATRHLGLEKVLVRLDLLDREQSQDSARPTEIVITDTGPQMKISWRTPHHDALHPARDYERRVVAARRSRLIYPYEIVRMLTSGERDAIEGENGGLALPPGRFEEYDLDARAGAPLAVPVERPYGGNPSAVVFGVISTPTEKVPEGLQRVLILSDPTRGMGALATPECERLVAAIDLAEKLDLPVEWLPVSSGARIAMDSGTENLDATARVVRRIVTFTQSGGAIHLIVQGVNVGAQSYFDALSTMLMHTRGVLIMTPGASMVLTGRAALEASGAVSAEDEVSIGGFESIMGPNGQAQYYARDLAEAYRLLYDYYRFSYVVPGESRPRSFATTDPRERSVCAFELERDGDGFATVGEIFDDATNPGRKRPFPMRAVMSALIDQDGGQLERWNAMAGAETAIVWDAHLGGHPVTLIGIESQSLQRQGYRPLDGPESWTGGTLFPLSSKKVARAISSASGNRPVVILANLSGFDGSPESMRKLQLEYGAEIARAVVNFEGPILFTVVSRYHGGAYVVFSQELNEGLRASALVGSFASVIGGGPAAAVVFTREVRARAVADPRVSELERALRVRPTAAAREALEALLAEVTLEKQAELADEFDEIHSVERAREVGSLDRIFPPDQLREGMIDRLDAFGSERGASPGQARPPS